MRIEAFLRESPLFVVTSTARHFESLTTRVLEEVDLSFLEALVLAAIFLRRPACAAFEPGGDLWHHEREREPMCLVA